MKFTRRDLLRAGVASYMVSSVSGIGRVLGAGEIRLGSVLDVSGAFEGYGKPMEMAARLAVDEINEGGGLNGEKVDLISYDTQSSMDLYSQYAQQLVRQDRVDVVHGGILSASREAIRQTFRKSKTLYFYNVLYEGGVCDRNIFITGVTPAQQVQSLIPEAIKRWGKKVYVLAADYNYGQNTSRWIEKYTKDLGGEIVETDYFPLDVSDFGSTITKIQRTSPDFIVSVLVGGAHLSFYRQWAASGMNRRIPMASTTLGVGNEHQILTSDEGDGILVAYNYSLERNSPENNAFKSSWRAKYGDTSSIHEIAVSHYQGLKLWAKAVREAGSNSRDKVIGELESGLSIVGPGGLVSIDPKTHHATLDVHLIEIKDQKMVVLKTIEQRPPSDTQAVCDLEANPNDNTQYELRF